MSTPRDKRAVQQEGEARKLKMTGLVERIKLVATRRVERAFLAYLMANGQGTTDDIRESVALPAGSGTSVWRAGTQALVQARLIRRVDFVTSSRPSRHGCHIGSWELRVEHAEVERWLQLSPDLPDPEPDDEAGAPSPTPSGSPSPTPLAVALTQTDLF
jgi:hypothetical protein